MGIISFSEKEERNIQEFLESKNEFYPLVYDAELEEKFELSCLIHDRRGCSVLHLQLQVLVHNLNQVVEQVYQDQ